MMLSTTFRFIWPSCYRGEDFLEINQSDKRIPCGGHVCYRGHSIDTSYKVSLQKNLQNIKQKTKYPATRIH
jgi:hypothetical protein